VATRTVTASTRTTAAPDAVWALLDDVGSWSTWGAWEVSELVAPPGPDGLGAVRRLQSGRTTAVERVVASEPPRLLRYELISGLPVRDYRASVEVVAEQDGGATITWSASFRGSLPFVGGAVRRRLDAFFADAVERLARAAESSSIR